MKEKITGVNIFNERRRCYYPIMIALLALKISCEVILIVNEASLEHIVESNWFSSTMLIDIGDYLHDNYIINIQLTE